MGISGKMYGRRGLQRAIRATIAKQHGLLIKVLHEFATNIANLATQLAPARPTSGRLKRSIRVEQTDEMTFAVLAGDEMAFYARFVEKGQGWDKIPRPYMQQAFDAYRAQLRPAIDRAFDEGVMPNFSITE